MAALGVSTGTNVHIGASYRDQGMPLTSSASALAKSWRAQAYLNGGRSSRSSTPGLR